MQKKYYIYAIATDCDGCDLYVFTGTEQQMKEHVRAKALDFINNYDPDYRNIVCGEENFAYPSYEAIVQYDDYHYKVCAIEQKYIKKLKVKRSSLYKAKKLEDDRMYVNEEDEEGD